MVFGFYWGTKWRAFIVWNYEKILVNKKFTLIFVNDVLPAVLHFLSEPGRFKNSRFGKICVGIWIPWLILLPMLFSCYNYRCKSSKSYLQVLCSCRRQRHCWRNRLIHYLRQLQYFFKNVLLLKSTYKRVLAYDRTRSVLTSNISTSFTSRCHHISYTPTDHYSQETTSNGPQHRPLSSYAIHFSKRSCRYWVKSCIILSNN